MNGLSFYLDSKIKTEFCAYGAHLLELTNPNASLFNQKPDVLFCFLDIQSLQENIDDIFRGLIGAKSYGYTIVINTVSFPPYSADTYLFNKLEEELATNQRILHLAKEHHFIVLDFFTMVKNYGYTELTVEKYWYMGRIKFSPRAFEIIAKELEDLLKKYRQSPKKCLVVDLDNTLWGGIVGEGEIELSNEGKGLVFKEFQAQLLNLSKLGVLLAICSKNNYEDAILGLNHPHGLLKADDFILIKANWQHKHLLVKEIAQELNIGENSLVFIDDNPVERELVSQLTEAIVPPFPEDIYELNSWFTKSVVYPYFYKFSLTEEDKQKHLQYKAKQKRTVLESSMDYEDFLLNLDIRLSFHVNEKKHIDRYAQLTQKTNQFNLTTKQYTARDIETFLANPERYLIIGVSYSDKFANEGITGLLIIEKFEDYAVIDTFLLSCRILKRNVEIALFKKAVEELPNNITIKANYIPTAKNILVKNLCLLLGFKEISENEFEMTL